MRLPPQAYIQLPVLTEEGFSQVFSFLYPAALHSAVEMLITALLSSSHGNLMRDNLIVKVVIKTLCSTLVVWYPDLSLILALT
jgi:hypothetical protein